MNLEEKQTRVAWRNGKNDAESAALLGILRNTFKTRRRKLGLKAKQKRGRPRG